MPLRPLVACLSLGALLSIAGAARADSDGYYCAGPGYLAWQWNGISVHTEGHVLRILALDGGEAEPAEVKLEGFQVHGMKCGIASVELRAWDAIHSVDLAQPVYAGKRSFDELDPPGFSQLNLGDLSRAGTTRLESADPAHVYELVIEKGERSEPGRILHHTTTTLVQKTRSGELVRRRTLYEGEAEETID